MGSGILALFWLAAAIIGVDAFVVYRYVSIHDSYAPLLDFVGRQPQFCRSIELLARRGVEGDFRAHEPLLESMQDYEETLGLLENRDPIESNVIEPPETIANALRRQGAVWNEVKPLLDEIVDSRGLIPLAAKLELDRGMTRLLQSSFEVVDAVARWRDDERLKMIRRVTAVSLAGLLVLLVALKVAWDRVVLPVRELREQALGIATRNRDEMPENEIDAVVETLADMSSSMSRLRLEQTRIKAELRRAETDYQSIFDNAVAGILRTDANGKPLMANRALARMLGYSCPGELLEALDDVHHQLFVDRNHRSRFERLHREHGHVELETKARRRDGSTVSVLESACSAESADKSLVYDMVIVDVTPLKKAQESLRNLSGRLLRSQDEERRRIARELHDSTGQLLAALGMNLGRIDQLLPELRDSVASSVELANDCSRQLRSMSYLLHPPMLEEMGLVYALQTFVKGFSTRSGIRVELDAPSFITRMDPDAELALFRVAQEALTNVQRHADSSDAIIRIRSTEAEIHLEVEDHGRGLDEDLLGSNGDSQLANMGVGVRGMEERLRQFMGRLSIESARGRTVVRAELPLSRPSSPADIPKV
ncbi:MAG TPA: PAS domain-containing sensor histidine kinase [Vicinamibacteria bacterium]|nr:PAS domain-containing sensor histidine kinase [Vicinamibacteria bacterium]